MQHLGLRLILGALIGGGVILSDTIPGYLRNQDLLASARAELSAAKQKLAAVGVNTSEADFRRAMSDAERASDGVRFAEDSVARRRDETLMYGGGARVSLQTRTAQRCGVEFRQLQLRGGALTDRGLCYPE